MDNDITTLLSKIKELSMIISPDIEIKTIIYSRKSDPENGLLYVDNTDYLSSYDRVVFRAKRFGISNFRISEDNLDKPLNDDGSTDPGFDYDHEDKYGNSIPLPIRTKEEEEQLKIKLDKELDDYMSKGKWD
jgi:hypothetical protein